MEDNKQITPLQKISNLMNGNAVKARFADMLGERASQFISSALSAVSNNSMLSKATPESVYGGTMMAAAVDLPINANLGFAYLVPYENKRTGITDAQFQIGARGFVQLAMRSGQYKTITTNVVYEGEVTIENRFTNELKFGDKTSDTVIGYLAYMKLVNGYEQYFYMTKAEMEEHARKYSKAYNSDLRYNKQTSLWTTNFDVMGKKTVLKLMLSKFGVLSLQMQMAQMYDQAVVRKEENDVQDITDDAVIYVDNDGDNGNAVDQKTLAEMAAEASGV